MLEIRHAALDLKTPANQLLEAAIECWLKRHAGKRSPQAPGT